MAERSDGNPKKRGEGKGHKVVKSHARFCSLTSDKIGWPSEATAILRKGERERGIR